MLAAGAGASLQAQLVDKTPLFHMSFDSVSGTTTGSIVTNTGSGGSALNGTVNVSADGTLAFVPGKFGNALSVSGLVPSDTSVRIANNILPLNVGAGQPAWSVAMWFQTTTVGGCYAYQGSGGWAGGNSSFYLTSGRSGGGTSGTHAGAVRNGQEWEEGTTDVNDGAWHHFVLTFDGTTKVMYLDGHVETFDENNWPGNGTGNQFWIGGNPYNGDGTANLNGLIDEVYVFNRALSLSDVGALYGSNNVPVVPVTVTVSPNTGYKGQSFTVTATATPAVGTVTNATANLSSLGRSATSSLVQASPNVFTNTFTVSFSTNALVGADNVKVTVISSEPLVGSGGAIFTLLARPPTNAIVLADLTNTSAFEYTEASFHFGTTNDAPNDTPFPMAYSWYTNSVLVSTNPMGPDYTFLTTPANNNMTVQAIARVADTNFSNLSVTSSVVTLTVNSGSLVYTNGLKQELFRGASRANVEIGNVGRGVVSLVTNADSAGGLGNNYTRRFSGYFIPQTTGAYVFFVASDDDCDLFLSTTDSNPDHKQLIAQENGWSGTRNWLTPGGAGSTAGQKRSDSFSPDGGITYPYSSGISLTAGQRYYFESVMHQGGGGDNWGVTYKLLSDLDPVDGTPSLLTVTNNNIAVVTYPGTSIEFTAQPTNLTVFEGDNANFSALATSDAEMTPNYQWYVNDAPYPGATGPQLTLALVPFSLNGASVYVIASTPEGNLSVTSSPVVHLTVNQAVFEPGYVKEDRWQGLTSKATVENGTVGAPTYTIAMPGFLESDNNSGNGQGDFALRQEGFFVPATTGSYIFLVDSDDDANLFVSTDNTPAHKRLVAREAGWSNLWNWNSAGGGGTIATDKRSDTFSPDGTTHPYAAGISLTAGQKYYVEMTKHNGAAGGTHVGATFLLMPETTIANGTRPALVGNLIGLPAPKASFVSFALQPSNTTANVTESATFSALGGDTDGKIPIALNSTGVEGRFTNNFFAYQWQIKTNGAADFSDIPGANSDTYTFPPPVVPALDGAQFRAKIRVLGYADNSLTPIWSNSQPAVLTVITNPVPPNITYAAVFQNTNQDPVKIVLNITFDKWMDPATLSNANYTVGGASVTNVSVSPTHNVVELDLDTMPSLPLTITVNGAKDLSGNSLANNSAPVNAATKLTFSDIGAPGASYSFGYPGVDPAYPSIIWVTSSNSYIVQAEGSDIWGATDGFNFGWELKTNDFDVVVRGVSQGHTSNYGKMGLMVREDLTGTSRNWNVVNDPASADGIGAPDGSGLGANNVEVNARRTNGVDTVNGISASWKTGGNNVPAYPNAWVRITRTGNVLTAYSSTNGVNWDLHGTFDTAGTNTTGVLGNVVYVGIATTAHNNDTFDNVPPFRYYNPAVYADYNSSYVAPALQPVISASVSGGDLIISWTPAGGHLESSPSLGSTANWQTVGTSNPATNSIGTGSQFFRVVNP